MTKIKLTRYFDADDIECMVRHGDITIINPYTNPCIVYETPEEIRELIIKARKDNKEN